MHSTSFIATASATALALAAAASGAQAQVINGGFESGLTGWTVYGDVLSQTGAGAPAGNARLFITTAATIDLEPDGFNVSGTSAVDASVLESASGLAIGALNTDAGGAYEGSLARQSFTALAGQTLSFIWSFGTRETGTSALPDYGFVVIDGKLSTLAGVASATLPGPGNDLLRTANASYSFTFTSGGSHSVAFGVVDVGDYNVRSSLSIDQVQLTSAVPEPQTLALMLGGLALVGGCAVARRRR